MLLKGLKASVAVYYFEVSVTDEARPQGPAVATDSIIQSNCRAFLSVPRQKPARGLAGRGGVQDRGGVEKPFPVRGR